jgi:hypothetical protein
MRLKAILILVGIIAFICVCCEERCSVLNNNSIYDTVVVPHINSPETIVIPIDTLMYKHF